MSQLTLERQQSIEQLLADERQALREIQDLREQQEKEQVRDRVLFFEDSGGIKIVSYNDYEKETYTRDPEGKEHDQIEEINVDDKNNLDTMYDIVDEQEQGELIIIISTLRKKRNWMMSFSGMKEKTMRLTVMMIWNADPL